MVYMMLTPSLVPVPRDNYESGYRSGLLSTQVGVGYGNRWADPLTVTDGFDPHY
jgi:hypothetical protein